jgi:GNAT superfamily N-acetyltransferase
VASFSDPRIVCRPALPADTADVLTFTRQIWDGRDYIHLVWDEWLADPQGLLISAQFGPRVVGIAKITPVFPGQWWLHGLRVDPEYQGLRICSHLHDYANDWWLSHGDGAIRLLTSTQRVQVHHLCERTGYTRLGEVITYRRSLGGAEGRLAADFQPVRHEEARLALDFVHRYTSWIGGLMDTGWRFVLPDESVLSRFIQDSHMHWWHGRDGLLATWEGDDDDGPVLGIGFAAVREAGFLADLLTQAVALADPRTVGGLFWLAPRFPQIESALKQAGYQTDKDAGVLFARKHPSL